MKDNDYYLRCAWRMETEGGSFAHYIARAYYCADKDNKEKLLRAFGQMFDRFAHTTQGESNGYDVGEGG